MTAQVGDRLRIGGRDVEMLSVPLEVYFEKHGHPEFASPVTCLWRGYVASWEFVNDWLSLVGVAGWLQTKNGTIASQNLPLVAVMPGFTGDTRATWFTGTLRLPRGRIIKREHLGFHRLHARDYLIEVECGRATEWVLFDHRAHRCVRAGTGAPVRVVSHMEALAGRIKRRPRQAIAGILVPP